MQIFHDVRGFLHMAHAFERYAENIKHDLRKSEIGTSNAFMNEAAESGVRLGKTREIASNIGEYVAAEAKKQILNLDSPSLSDARVDIRERGGTAGKPEPNVMGASKPLISSGALMNSINYATDATLDGTDIHIGVLNSPPMMAPDGTNPADYAVLQELGGVSGGMISGKDVPPRPFLVPALVESAAAIEQSIVPWLEVTWRASAKF